MGLPQLSNLLWQERHLLELLLFKLEEEQLIVAAGKSRWFERAAQEVEMVREAIRSAKLYRAAEVEAVARELGLPVEPSLRDVSAAAPAPWRDILAEHRRELLELTNAVGELVDIDRERVTAAL